MQAGLRTATLVLPLGAMLVAGCAAPKLDFSKLVRPPRAAELDAYDTFVGSWTWEATVLNSVDPEDKWTGTATWRWILDRRCLHGVMSVRSAHADFDADGIWSWDAKAKKYRWSMFNSWGYPQEGTADYCSQTRSWTMRYRSIGLDGGSSYGRYIMTVVDDDTLDWQLVEWADPLHVFKKIEMSGTYKRVP